MKEGDIIVILHSIALHEMKLRALAGRKAFVVEVVRDGDIERGCWVQLEGEPYEGEREWFIPQISVGQWKIY